MQRLFRFGLLLLVLAGLVIGGLILVQHKKRELSRVEPFGSRPRPVTVTAARQGDLRRESHYLAVVEPSREADVSARVTAEIEEVLVDEGDAVQTGQPLIRLDAAEVKHRLGSLRARISEAKAQLAAKRATVQALEDSLAYWRAEKERDRKLEQRGAVSSSRAGRTAEKASEVRGRLRAARQESQAIQQRIRSLQQQTKEVQTKLGYYTLESPFRGRVAERLADPGDLASPSRKLLRLHDETPLRLAFAVPQDDLPGIGPGLEVAFTVQDETRRNEIDVLHPSLNRSRMMRAEIRLEEAARQGLSPGAYVPLSVTLERLDKVTLVPRSAVIESPQGRPHVFALRKGRLEAQRVTVLGYDGDEAALEGISPGTEVVRSTFLGWARLSSGEQVEAVR